MRPGCQNAARPREFCGLADCRCTRHSCPISSTTSPGASRSLVLFASPVGSLLRHASRPGVGGSRCLGRSAEEPLLVTRPLSFLLDSLIPPRCRPFPVHFEREFPPIRRIVLDPQSFLNTATLIVNVEIAEPDGSHPKLRFHPCRLICEPTHGLLQPQL